MSESHSRIQKLERSKRFKMEEIDMSENVGKALESAIKEPETTTRPGGSSEDARIFGNQVRRSVFSILTFHPCMGINDIADALEVSNSTVKWHLEKLVASGYLVERHFGRKRAFWPEGQLKAEDIPVFCTLSSNNTKRLLIDIIRVPGLTQKEYSEEFGMTHQGIATMAARLESAGLIKFMVEGIHTRYYPTRLLAELSETRYKHTKAFREFIIEKLKKNSEMPKIIKSSGNRLLLQIGPKNDLHIIEIGLDPFMSVLDG